MVWNLDEQDSWCALLLPNMSEQRQQVDCSPQAPFSAAVASLCSRSAVSPGRARCPTAFASSREPDH